MTDLNQHEISPSLSKLRAHRLVIPSSFPPRSHRLCSAWCACALSTLIEVCVGSFNSCGSHTLLKLLIVELLTANFTILIKEVYPHSVFFIVVLTSCRFGAELFLERVERDAACASVLELLEGQS